MKQNNYRNSYAEHKPARRKTVYKILLFLVLCAGIIWYVSNDGFDGIVPVDLPLQTDDGKAGTDGKPVLTVALDGARFTIDAQNESQEASNPADDALQCLEMTRSSKLELRFDKPPDSFNITLYKDNSIVFSGMNATVFSDDLEGDGQYIGVCEANWTSGANKGNARYRFKILADFPYELAISTTEIDPGELLVICATNLNPDESMDIETDLDFKPNTFQVGNKRFIMLPVSYYNKSGKVYQVKVIINGEPFSYAVRLNDKEFTTQYMTIDTKVAAETRNDKSAQEVTDKVNPLKPVSDAEPYWTDKFIMPVEGGRVTETDFGKRRYVNKAPTSYRHNGLDIGQDQGTPVMASNNGRVLLADYLIGTGNTIILEHGLGLKTWYYHMSELKVKTGDLVMQGDIIGKVGSTGFSTGPHLHFSASVNNVFINPITLIHEGVPFINGD